MIFVRSACVLAALGLLNGAGLAMGQSADPSMPNDAASAGANPNRERAKQLYEEGLTAYRAGKYSDAIDKKGRAGREECISARLSSRL